MPMTTLLWMPDYYSREEERAIVQASVEGIPHHVPATARTHLPTGVAGGTYRISPPLIKPSRLTSKGKGGVGKDLSDGWCLNFAVGCSHGCDFCYVDEIFKRFGRKRYGDLVLKRWGDYMRIPENLEQAIQETPWQKWKGQEVMMSSTHDPYVPVLANWTRRILESALPAGVRFCIQTRSFLATRDFDLLTEYRNQVRLQVSIATMNADFATSIERRVPPSEARLEILRRAKRAGLETGVILAPIFPPMDARPDADEDLKELIEAIARIGPDHVYGESLHPRGQNLRLVEEDLGQTVPATDGFDRRIARAFHRHLANVGMKGTWWYEH